MTPPTLKSLLDSHEARMDLVHAAARCQMCGGDFMLCPGATFGPDGLRRPCVWPLDPEPVTLTYIPSTGRRADLLGWFLLGLVVGLIAGAQLFFD